MVLVHLSGQQILSSGNDMILKLKYRLVISIIDIISKSWRFRIQGDIPTSKGVLAFWHGKMLPVWKLLGRQKPFAIVSPSRDGEILSKLLQIWGYKLIRGSSDKDAKNTLKKIVQAAENDLVLITPDGPKGPRNLFKAGAVVAACRSNSNLYICKIDIKWKILFRKSWDHFELPLPFTKIYFQFIHIGLLSDKFDRSEIEGLINKSQSCLNSEINAQIAK